MYFITVRKRRLGQGNVFTGVCPQGGAGVWLTPPDADPRPRMQTLPPARYMGYNRIRSSSGRYTSYWNTLLFFFKYFVKLYKIIEVWFDKKYTRTAFCNDAIDAIARPYKSFNILLYSALVEFRIGLRQKYMANSSKDHLKFISKSYNYK